MSMESWGMPREISLKRTFKCIALCTNISEIQTKVRHRHDISYWFLSSRVMETLIKKKKKKIHLKNTVY